VQLTGQIKQNGDIMAKPTNPKLYNRVKNEIKGKVKVWPSAYASALLVKTYKARGGKYSGSSKNKVTTRSKKS
jgi:hypothetical protein